MSLRSSILIFCTAPGGHHSLTYLLRVAANRLGWQLFNLCLISFKRCAVGVIDLHGRDAYEIEGLDGDFTVITGLLGVLLIT